jgi:cytochrome c peroxidase
MTCHSQIWTNASMLEPVRASYRDDKSLEWIRVNALPDFVYFDHSIHVAKGVGCTTCHGQIAQMPLTERAGTLYMSWCLECHRQPEKYLRPKSEVFNPYYEPPSGAKQLELGKKLMAEYHVQSLQTCSTCHR